jgi:copper chaperone NosL
MSGKEILVLFVAIGSLACSTANPEPVEIVLNEETCSQCRMAVSERQFAAEVVMSSGAVHFFDDIGCLGQWVKINEPPESAGMFVIDYITGEWLDAAEAHYVLSESLPTPMGYGLAAFQSSASAQGEAEKLSGQVVRWNRILEEMVK